MLQARQCHFWYLWDFFIANAKQMAYIWEENLMEKQKLEQQSGPCPSAAAIP